MGIQVNNPPKKANQFIATDTDCPFWAGPDVYSLQEDQDLMCWGSDGTGGHYGVLHWSNPDTGSGAIQILDHNGTRLSLEGDFFGGNSFQFQYGIFTDYISLRDLRMSTNVASTVIGAGAGAGATISNLGQANAGKITVNTAGIPAAASTIATVTFSFARPNTTYFILLTPANAATALLSGVTMVYPGNLTTTAWDIISGSTGLTTGTTYAWNYFLVGGP